MDPRLIRLLVVEDSMAYLHLIQQAFRGRREQNELAAYRRERWRGRDRVVVFGGKKRGAAA
jgi:hypothetical protein